MPPTLYIGCAHIWAQRFTFTSLARDANTKVSHRSGTNVTVRADCCGLRYANLYTALGAIDGSSPAHTPSTLRRHSIAYVLCITATILARAFTPAYSSAPIP